MLCLRRETDYALQLVRHLAEHKGGSHSLKMFAKEEDISFWFMQKIARKLSQAGIIKAEQGVKGGYRLAIPPKKLTVYHVVQVMEGNPALVACLEKGSKCARGKQQATCTWRTKMSSINRQLVELLQKEKVIV